MADETEEQERPLERAARSESAAGVARGAATQAEREADAVVADIDDYVAQTNPQGLLQAEQALEAWQIPTHPLDGVPGDVALEPGIDGEPLVSVFSARTESEANIVRGVLESEGIAVIFREVATPSYGSVFSVSESRWADLLVSASEAEQARAVLVAATEQE